MSGILGVNPLGQFVAKHLSSNNYVSTQVPRTDLKHYMAPVYWKGCTTAELMDVIKNILVKTKGFVEIITEDSLYLHATFVSTVLKIIDDVEIFINERDSAVHFRSGSRGIAYDFGINRKRMLEVCRTLISWINTPRSKAQPPPPNAAFTGQQPYAQMNPQFWGPQPVAYSSPYAAPQPPTSQQPAPFLPPPEAVSAQQQSVPIPPYAGLSAYSSTPNPYAPVGSVSRMGGGGGGGTSVSVTTPAGPYSYKPYPGMPLEGAPPAPGYSYPLAQSAASASRYSYPMTQSSASASRFSYPMAQSAASAPRVEGGYTAAAGGGAGFGGAYTYNTAYQPAASFAPAPVTTTYSSSYYNPPPQPYMQQSGGGGSMSYPPSQGYVYSSQ